MSDVSDTIKIGELVLATAEGLIDAIGRAKQSLEESTAQLKQSITEAKKKLHDDLAADRKEADEALDRKFDHPDGAASDDDGT
jgi:F0F1-type ATP synthase membrane subunit b/b'